LGCEGRSFVSRYVCMYSRASNGVFRMARRLL
jgi:hypothetical protein